MGRMMVINAAELSKWMEDSWQLYASETVYGTLRRLWVNHKSEYKVQYGEDLLYLGKEMTHAIAAWEGAPMAASGLENRGV